MAKPLTIQILPCTCSLLNSEPHHHTDTHTVIPWDVFVKSVEDFGNIGSIVLHRTKQTPDDDSP